MPPRQQRGRANDASSTLSKEVGYIRKPHGGRLRVALAFPNTYFVMDDSHTGVFGLVAIVSVLLLKIHALESMDVDRWRALLVAPILGRWAMVLLAYRSKAAKAGLGSNLIDHLQTKHFLVATLLTLLLVVVIFRGNGIFMMAWVAVFTTASKSYFHRRLGGVTGDTFGAVGELSETSVVVLLAL